MSACLHTDHWRGAWISSSGWKGDRDANENVLVNTWIYLHVLFTDLWKSMDPGTPSSP